VLLSRTGDDAYRACPELVARVRAGCFGRKTGRGFFEYAEVLS
jgi:methoxymalonate biosynthesis protein